MSHMAIGKLRLLVVFLLISTASLSLLQANARSITAQATTARILYPAVVTFSIQSTTVTAVGWLPPNPISVGFSAGLTITNTGPSTIILTACQFKAAGPSTTSFNIPIIVNPCGRLSITLAPGQSYENGFGTDVTVTVPGNYVIALLFTGKTSTGTTIFTEVGYLILNITKS